MRHIIYFLIFIPIHLFSSSETIFSHNLQQLEPLIDYLIHNAEQHKQNPSKPVPMFAIGGCPGVGKTTLTKILIEELQFRGISCISVALDDFVLPASERKLMGNWNINHLKIEELHHCLSSIFAGEKALTKPTYDQMTGEIGTESFDLNDRHIILFEGLYALCSEDPINFFKYSIQGAFLEADECDIYRWRVEREQKKINPRTDEQLTRHVEALINEYHQNIECSRNNVKFIIQKDHNHSYHLEIQNCEISTLSSNLNFHHDFIFLNIA